MHRRQRAEFLTGPVAHRDDEVAVLLHLGRYAAAAAGAAAGDDAPRRRSRPARSPPPGGFRPMPPGPYWPGATARPPDASARSWRCTRTAPAAPARRRVAERIEHTRDQAQVAAAAVPLERRRVTTGLLEHVQMVGEQVGRHREHRRQFRRGDVAGAERVGDLQPGRVGQRRMDRCPADYVSLCSVFIDSILTELFCSSRWRRDQDTAPGTCGAVAGADCRVPRQRLPGRRRDRLGHRRAALVPRCHRAGVAGERGGDRGRAVRDHLDVRPGLRRPLQPGGVVRRCGVRRAALAGRRGLPAGAGGRLHRRGGRWRT